MLLTSRLPLSVITSLMPALLASASFAQTISKLEAPLPDVAKSRSLSQTLLGFGDKTRVNVVADTTTQADDPDANRLESVDGKLTVGQFLTEQGPVYGFYWSQPDPNTVLVWPKTGDKTIATQVVQLWQQQPDPYTQLSPEVAGYFTDVAQKLDEEKGAAGRRTSLNTTRLSLKLSPQLKTALRPLARWAQHQRVQISTPMWLSDSFWQQATVTLSKFGDGSMWIVGSKGFGQGLLPPIPRAGTPESQGSLVTPEADAAMGSRGLSQPPASLNKPVQIRVESVSVESALERIAQLCGVSLSLDARAKTLVRDKRLTLDTSDVTAAALLRDIALLFDLQWKADGDKWVASPNETLSQNVAAKIGSVSSIQGWRRQYIAIHPDWAPLVAQEVAQINLAPKRGVPLAKLSPELQGALRSYSENLAIIDTLERWQNPSLDSTEFSITWNIDPVFPVRTQTPPPEPTAEEKNDPQFMADYNAKRYELRRSFRLRLAGSDWSHTHLFRPGLLIPKIPPQPAPQ